MNIIKSLKTDLKKIRKKKPLVHHITNQVVMNDSANITIGIGASPVMAHSKKEVEDMTKISNSLLLNIGTPDKKLIESMLLSGKKASQMNIPIILDPVGSGATPYRTNKAKKILDTVNVKIIKGNAGEISSLLGSTGKVKGVESDLEKDSEIVEMAEKLSNKYDAIVSVTGKTDIVTDGTKTKEVYNGVEMLSNITGSGCMLGSIIASFSSVNEDYYLATLEGLLVYEISAEMAAENIEGPGDFRKNLLNEIFNININKIRGKINLR